MRNLSVAAATLALSAAIAAPALGEDEALVTFRAMKPELAVKLAQAALAACRKEGAQVAVAVVDRSGVVQALVRDRFAGPHTPETARRKAWTAVSFRNDTLSLVEATKPGSEAYGAHFIDGALMVGGGVPVEARGAIIGAVGVSGAPGGAMDDKCGRAGIEAVADDLAF